MKKTLITLAALAMASMAQAEITWTEVDTDVTATWKSENEGCHYYDLTFALDFEFSADSLENGTSAIVAYVTDGRTAGNVVQFSYVLNRDNEGVYTLTMGRTNATNVLASLTYSSGGDNPTQALTAGTVYTLSADDTYMGSKITWKDANGAEQVNTRNFDDYIAVDTSLVSSAEDAAAAHKVMLNSAFVPSAITPGTPAIPEPTTATLSLLALAGLAARRRRK